MGEVKQMNRLHFIDFIKGVAILFVVVGHLIQGNFPSDSIGGERFSYITGFTCFIWGCSLPAQAIYTNGKTSIPVLKYLLAIS